MFGRNNKLNRDSWLADILSGIPEGYSLLDAGAGEQQYRPLCAHLKYTSQDFCQYDGGGDSKGLQTGKWSDELTDIVGDICEIPVADNSFDVVLCTEVLEHIPDPRRALKELARVVKPGGQLIVTAPFCSMTHFAPYFFSTGFSDYFYKEMQEELNLEITRIEKNGNYFEYLAQELTHLPRMGKMYSSGIMGWFSLLVSVPLYLMLWLMHKRDRGSAETLCFGIHIVFKKPAE